MPNATDRGTMQSAQPRSRVLFAVPLAVLLFAAAVTTASARNLSVSSQNIRFTFRSLEFASEIFTIRCPVTLEGSFHARTIAKVGRSLIGAITRASAKEESCTNGRLRYKNLPFHLTYEGFQGALPNINSVLFLLNRVRWEIIISGFCTADYGLETDNITYNVSREAGRGLTTIEPVAGRNIVNRVSGSGICAARSTFLGTGNPTVLNSSARVTVTLI